MHETIEELWEMGFSVVRAEVISGESEHKHTTVQVTVLPL
jgi:hypothetical protein